MNKLIARVMALTLLLIGGLAGVVMAEPSFQVRDHRGPDPKFVQWAVTDPGSALREIDSFIYYNISNDHERGEYLEYGQRTWGINLVWDSDRSLDFVAKGAWFVNCTRPGQSIYGSDEVAIRFHKGGYLVYGSRSSGPDLNWYWSQNNSQPPSLKLLRENACQWRLVPSQGSSFGPTRPNDFAFYNVKRQAYLIYQTRSRGINLGWDSEPAPGGSAARADLVPEAVEILQGRTVDAIYLSIANRGNVPIDIGAHYDRLGVRIGSDTISIPGGTLAPGRTLRVPIRSSAIPEICENVRIEVDTNKVYQGGRNVFANDSQLLTLTDFRGEVNCRPDVVAP